MDRVPVAFLTIASLTLASLSLADSHGPAVDMMYAPVSGHVFHDRNANGVRDPGETGVAGVAMSNQREVVRTDASGAFELPSAGPTGILFVSVPDGYAARAFYRTIDTSASNRGPIDFALTTLARPSVVTFVHASDTHIAAPVLTRTQRLRHLVDSISPQFVLITGDLVRDALRVSEEEAVGYYELFQREVALIRPPVFTVPGNHEIFGIERDKSGVSPTHPLFGRVMYRHYRGPDYYSFTRAGVHFVALNTVDIDDTRYYGHVDSTQLAWLERDLAAIPAGMPVVTFNHIPFFTAMEVVQGLKEAPPAPSIITIGGKNQFRHTVSNAAAVLAAIKGHPYPLALAGHMHARERLRFEGLATRFDQAAAIVGPSPGPGTMFTSGITVYRITRGHIDDGKFVPLGLDAAARK
jgi:predicted MPP superfamily phosphohydrolase